MATTTFVDGSTRSDDAWFQAVNDLIYLLFGVTDGVTHTAAMARAALKTGGFLTSVAGTNTITATAAIAPVTYVAGDSYVIIPANTNTGATTLNLNSLGAKNVFVNGAACVGNELVANVPALVVYDGTQFNIVSLALATQAQMEAASSNLVAVTPGRLKNHPGVPKAWVRFAGSDGTVSASFGVTSVTRNGAGDYTVTFSTAFSAAGAYAFDGQVFDSGGSGGTAGLVSADNVNSAMNTGTCRFITVKRSDGSNYDPTNVMAFFYGDQ